MAIAASRAGAAGMGRRRRGAPRRCVAMTVLQPGRTCWRIGTSSRVAPLVDNEAYYAALLAALQAARRSIYILGWAFDPRTRLSPDGTEGPDDPDEIGRILIELCQARPELDVRLLVWRSPLGINGHQDIRGHRARRRFSGTPVVFREARDVPFGASHHQKVIVIDDQIAFCGGGDIVPNRWDTVGHSHIDSRRILPDRTGHPPRHEVMVLVDGPPAGALGDLFRERWASATGQTLGAARPTGPDPWPAGTPPRLADARVAIARTRPGWRDQPLTDEIRQLTLACIADARRTIYLENQYFTCRTVSDALEARLGELDGPEIVLVVNGRAPSWFDRLTMDHARNPLIRRLRAADRFGRFLALSPSTSAGGRIIVHSKVSVIDDRILRIGSANLNNRSGGFDTECDLAIEGESDAARRAISDFRDLLISHYLALEPADFTRARLRGGGVIAALDVLNQQGRLAPLATGRPGGWERLVAGLGLGDPPGADQSWRLRLRQA